MTYFQLVFSYSAITHINLQQAVYYSLKDAHKKACILHVLINENLLHGGTLCQQKTWPASWEKGLLCHIISKETTRLNISSLLV
jgi:hypothetical protein